MLWGKLLSGLRVSSVLTLFLMWPVILACIMPLEYWNNLPTMGGFFLVVAFTCVTTAMTALFCSSLFYKSSTSLMATYLIILTLFLGPVAGQVFVDTFLDSGQATTIAQLTSISSPFSAVFNMPLKFTTVTSAVPAKVAVFWGYLGFTMVYNLCLLLAMMWLFQSRWRVSE